jgi:hypothetical protein
MTLQEKVRAFVVRRAPRPICDDCLADHLALSRKQVCSAKPVPQEDGRFRRFLGRCSGCCTKRTVTVLAEG